MSTREWRRRWKKRITASISFKSQNNPRRLKQGFSSHLKKISIFNYIEKNNSAFWCVFLNNLKKMSPKKKYNVWANLTVDYLCRVRFTVNSSGNTETVKTKQCTSIINTYRVVVLFCFNRKMQLLPSVARWWLQKALSMKVHKTSTS